MNAGPARYSGHCDACGRSFSYQLVHSGFNNSAFAYCTSCGMTAILDLLKAPMPAQYGPLTPPAETHLQACPCGGHFSGSAAPRCPHCCHALSAERATEWIEATAPGTKKGWRWSRSWQTIYCMIIEDRFVYDNWK